MSLLAVSGAGSIKDEIIGKLSEEGTPDYIMIHKTVDTLYPLINFIVGLIIIVSASLLLIIIALEVFYLVAPGVKGSLNSKVINSEGKSARPLELILHDAIKSYDDYVNCGCERNLLFIYLERKMRVLIIYGLCFAVACGYGSDFAHVMDRVIVKTIEVMMNIMGV